MPDAETDTELAAETFKNTVRLKNKLINELKEKHGVNPRITSLKAISRLVRRLWGGYWHRITRTPRPIAKETRKYQAHLLECKRFRRYIRSIHPPRKRSPSEVQQQQLNRLIKDIAIHKIRNF